ncbi:hypothetical protein C5167_047035 [Papaver somniferum]|uniref:Uncharacterized protein n=1 Tax=Papaver somniferum TaxID=3469 RepID=A0A4Y7LJ96_PAPSO|nr:hypothetical protein C5167_047035 [Papaver somniferum]
MGYEDDIHVDDNIYNFTKEGSIPLRLLKDAMGVVHPTNAAGQFRTPGFEKLKLPVTSSTQST